MVVQEPSIVSCQFQQPPGTAAENILIPEWVSRMNYTFIHLEKWKSSQRIYYSKLIRESECRKSMGTLDKGADMGFG